MKMRIASLLLLTILCLALSATAFAAPCAPCAPCSPWWCNDGLNGHYDPYFIQGDAVSDSFQSNVSINMNGFTFGDWVPAGNTPLTVDWSIGTSPFENQLGSGIGAISATLLCSSGQPFNGGICGDGLGYDVYSATVNTGTIGLTSGTYWLTLTGATDNQGGLDGWDINSGPSTAYHSRLGQVPSEWFTINGSTPEPSSIMLFGSGILGLAGVLRRKLTR